MLIVDNEFVTLEYVEDKKYLHHTIHKPVDEEVFKAMLLKGIELMGQNKIEKWLSDDRLNGPFSEAFSGWVMSEFIPRSIAAGWKNWANVVPVQVEAADTLTPFIEVLHGMGLRMMVFSDLNKAQAWIEKL